MFKVNNKDTRTGAVPEHISYLVLVFLLLNLRRQMAAGNATLPSANKQPCRKANRCWNHIFCLSSLYNSYIWKVSPWEKFLMVAVLVNLDRISLCFIVKTQSVLFMSFILGLYFFRSESWWKFCKLTEVLKLSFKCFLTCMKYLVLVLNIYVSSAWM